MITTWDAARTHPIHGCTLGFNARLSTDQSGQYFVTNSHCTSTFAASTSDSAYQADFTQQSDAAIGYEVQDPAWRTDIPQCPTFTSNQKCRYSDAALFRYTQASYSDFPYIAMDSSVSSTLGVNGSRFRVDSFVVIANYPEAKLLAADTVNRNTWLMKVGNTSGWTWGPIRSTCLNFYAYGGTLKCQYKVLAEAKEGDSGSPVFEYTSFYLGIKQATLAGVLHSATPGLYYYFSSITGIKNDIANLVTY